MKVLEEEGEESRSPKNQQLLSTALVLLHNR